MTEEEYIAKMEALRKQHAYVTATMSGDSFGEYPPLFMNDNHVPPVPEESVEQGGDDAYASFAQAASDFLHSFSAGVIDVGSFITAIPPSPAISTPAFQVSDVATDGPQLTDFEIQPQGGVDDQADAAFRVDRQPVAVSVVADEFQLTQPKQADALETMSRQANHGVSLKPDLETPVIREPSRVVGDQPILPQQHREPNRPQSRVVVTPKAETLASQDKANKPAVPVPDKGVSLPPHAVQPPEVKPQLQSLPKLSIHQQVTDVHRDAPAPSPRAPAKPVGQAPTRPALPFLNHGIVPFQLATNDVADVGQAEVQNPTTNSIAGAILGEAVEQSSQRIALTIETITWSLINLHGRLAQVESLLRNSLGV